MSFLSLPPEIRRIVYVFAFPSVRILIGTSSGEGSHEERLHHQLDQSDSWRGRRAARSLLLTCKTVSDEATAYLYSQPTFCFDSTVALNFFLDRTPLSSRAAVRSLEFVREFDMPGSSFKGEELATLEEACWCVAYVRANVDIPNIANLTFSATFSQGPLTFKPGSPEFEWMLCFKRSFGLRFYDRVTVNIHTTCQEQTNRLPQYIDLCRTVADSLMTRASRLRRDMEESQKVLAQTRAVNRPPRTLVLKLDKDGSTGKPVHKKRRAGIEEYSRVHNTY